MRALGAALLALAAAAPAQADPLRLSADAYFGAEPPVGLMQLSADAREGEWLEAEASVWTGADDGLDGDDGADGDALVIAMRARDPKGRGEARAGRFVLATGAVRPRHLDGGHIRARSDWGSDLELFGGIPVAPHFGADAFDWLVGGRASHHIGDTATAGLSFVHERDRGFLADQEVGADVGVLPTNWLDLAAQASLDTVNPGIAVATLSAAARHGAFRHELHGARRSPSRMLPATSLFAVLGDVPSDEVGLTTRWRAAPRLDLWGDASARQTDDDLGAELSLKGVLRLDDHGEGSLLLEGRRSELGAQSGWTGVRTGLRMPAFAQTTLSSELELVVPDEPRGRGAVWPWALVALSRGFEGGWKAALAVEAHASPESEGVLSALGRVSRTWGQP